MIEPFGQRIIVKRLSEAEHKGILIPDQARRTSLVGKVLHKGPEANWVEIGDIVHFARFSGCDVKADLKYVGAEYEDCLYMNCDDLLGVIQRAQGIAGLTAEAQGRAALSAAERYALERGEAVNAARS